MQAVQRFNLGRLLLCEGPEDVAFFCALIQDRQIPDFHVQHTGMERWHAGGNTKFGEKLRALKLNRSFNNLYRIVLVTDSDDDAASAFTDACTQILQAGLLAPNHPFAWGGGRPAVSVITLPPGSEGALESYCEPAARSTNANVAASTDTFLANVHADQWPERLRGKLWLRAYTSARNRSNPSASLVQIFEERRANGHIIPVSHGTFDHVTNFLRTC